MNRLLFNVVVLPALISLLGLHGRSKKRRRTQQSGQSNEGDSRQAEGLLDEGDVDQANPPADTTPTPKPKKPKPKFKFDEAVLDQTWEKHRPGGMYDSMRPPKRENVFHPDFTKEDLRKALQDAQEHGVERPRGVNSDDLLRGGNYVDYDPYTGKQTGLQNQTGLRIPIAPDGNMKTAYPWEL
jgi:hypothetical protein